ncbi:MAG: trans-aconitate 2-methyltransferase [Rhodospirillaceae bacterium]|nr:trans-aconitate 2-methyltransferase [Rhodospirillaceae bacterium]
MSWSAAQYTKFERERTRPVRDLLLQIPVEDAKTAVDLGCGPGNSTELLKARFPNAAITGMDSSSDMIEAARKRMPDIHFEIDDIATWHQPGPFDVIFANASLQWVPDHARLLPTLMEKLAPGGSLAVQMPDNLDEPAHQLMAKVGREGPWAKKIEQAETARVKRQSPDWYYRILGTGGAQVDLWRTVYFHPLAGGAPAVVEWFKATGLRPYLTPLDEAERKDYLAKYEAEIALAYPALPNGTVVLPFPRLFFVATR